MKGPRLFLVVFAWLLMTGCGLSEQKGIQGSAVAPTYPPASGEPALVQIEELVAAPEVFAGRRVRFTGRYEKLPVIVCDESSRQFPAVWGLTDGEETIPVRGYERQVGNFLPEGLLMTVEGTWRLWTGPQGCGKGASVGEVWFLRASSILAPNPVVRITLTPRPGAATATPALIAGATVTPLPTGPGPVGTPIVQPSATTTVVGPTATPSGSGTQLPPTPTLLPQATTPPAQEQTPTATAQGGTAPTAAPSATASGTPPPTATATATPGVEASPTASATSGASPTATPTATQTKLPDRNVVNKGGIDFQDLQGDRLNTNEAHRWDLSVRAGDVITVNVAGSPTTDITLQLLDPNGGVAVQQNDSPAGEVEIIAGYEVGSDGSYRLLISEANAQPADYAVLTLSGSDNDYYPFLFRGIISYGQSVTDDLRADSDHFWSFQGTNGEIISFTVSPNDNSDVFFELYDPRGVRIVDFTDGNGGGAAEELTSFQLQSSGIFSIRVGEFRFDPSDYTLDLRSG